MTGSTVVPTFHYRDAPAMIAFLCEVIGFSRKAVHEDGQGGVAHAELVLGAGMVMLGSDRGEAGFGAHQAPPVPGGRVTSSAYVVVASDDEVRAVHDRAAAAGAGILAPPTAQSYGGLNLSFRDPEGGVWSVGSYDPWS